MNSRSGFIILIVFGLLLAALVSRNGHFALMALPFLVSLGLGIYNAPSEIRLSACRTVSSCSTTPSGSVDVKLVLENNGGAPLDLQLVEPRFHSMDILGGSFEQSMALAAGEKVELSYSFRANRGSYTWNTVRVIVSDPFGWLEQTIELPAESEVLVFPDRKKLKHISLRPQRLIHTAGPFPSRLAGSGTDFFGIRQYQMGDPMRWIYWRLSARHPDKYFTKEFEREEIADIVMILDTRCQTHSIHGDEKFFEFSVQATASLAETFLGEGNRLGLVSLGGGIRYIFPGSGKGQLFIMLRHLARASTGSNVSLDHLRFLPMRLFPSRALIVIVSPLDVYDLRAFVYLRSYGYQVLLISPNPIDFAARGLSTEHSSLLSVRAARVERALQLSQLRKIGVDVIDWQVDQPLAKTIHTSLMNRQSHLVR